MSKYCIYWDRPAGFDLDGEFFGGCTILGVHHSCEKCPNLIEMGDGGITYSDNKIKENEQWKP